MWHASAGGGHDIGIRTRWFWLWIGYGFRGAGVEWGAGRIKKR